jgi:mannitol/fructose-specific phosphotransferase system IIA component
MRALDFGLYQWVSLTTLIYIYQNTVILVVLKRILDFSIYMGVLMRIPYLGVSKARSYIHQNTVILVVFKKILDFSTYLDVLMRILYLGFS